MSHFEFRLAECEQVLKDFRGQPPFAERRLPVSGSNPLRAVRRRQRRFSWTRRLRTSFGRGASRAAKALGVHLGRYRGSETGHRVFHALPAVICRRDDDCSETCEVTPGASTQMTLYSSTPIGNKHKERMGSNTKGLRINTSGSKKEDRRHKRKRKIILNHLLAPSSSASAPGPRT